ncbi:MAG: XrtA/PEP-CTERM system exopolysaccharide export protein [Ferrovum myxofaciens]|uniref:Polysaccharide biosynthesis/export protein n=2 Tax=root TaxID=1 RepID=A0A859ACE0_9PROT|nr:XrtA/PEP-CTERM system exopolysaccharide export protein [Ferrovum myxofaciens]KXW58035.1 polysaccharide biosynthesis/export protein [Ferrovum myxofaciens]MBU6995429.1 polysaccharide export protein [Ferrovum myxofaciens]QKE39845.2 MAG: polysaccharide export protein [Ferrovum myxofaciens]QWY74475.1 MAG: polysaccharide export protein [Ferrovum myxofaciens]QWY77222.1 MAG: polysaccharide export protein [Ferrovum myxofaciens]
MNINQRLRQFFGSFKIPGLALCGLFVVACSTTRPPAPTNITEPDHYHYIIGPGDTVKIMVWHNTELSQAIPVRPDGKISTPLAEDMQAAGKTPTHLARDLEVTLAKYIQSPVVTVIVEKFVGPYNQQIRVIGQATKPQTLQYNEHMTLMDVMIAVGGITDFAAGNRATILRTVNGKQEQYRVKLQNLMRDGDISANVPMLPGDVLIIPESFF